MRNLIYVIILTISWIPNLNASLAEPVLSLPSLPAQYLEKRFQQIQQGFEQRAILFLKGLPFQPWRANKSRQEILKEFHQVNEWRFHTWYVNPKAKFLIARTDFMIAQDLLEKGFYRKPALIAFEYNQTDGSYNSSTIVLNGFKFLALEAPTASTLRNFFLLLQNYRVTQLVRLTAAEENDSEKSYTYWTDKLKLEPKTNSLYLNVPQQYNASPYPIHYYATESWLDNQGIGPQQLLALIQKVRQQYDPKGLIACHSSNGIGRAGTFVAGFLLLNEIDKQIAAGISKDALDISIEKIVMQLSLQRSHFVRTPEQYIALYRLVDLYVQGLK